MASLPLSPAAASSVVSVAAASKRRAVRLLVSRIVLDLDASGMTSASIGAAGTRQLWNLHVLTAVVNFAIDRHHVLVKEVEQVDDHHYCNHEKDDLCDSGGSKGGGSG